MDFKKVDTVLSYQDHSGRWWYGWDAYLVRFTEGLEQKFSQEYPAWSNIYKRNYLSAKETEAVNE